MTKLFRLTPTEPRPIVVGAGMAGLIAANVLRNECAAVVERQPTLPHNHSAVLRFRGPEVGEAVGIPFRRVPMLKTVQRWRNPVADAMAYAHKVSGGWSLRSIVNSSDVATTRWIAPEDFIPRLAANVSDRIALDSTITTTSLLDRNRATPIISTMPMPALMDLLGWETEEPFRWRAGVNVVARLRGSDAHVSVYNPDPDQHWYRASLTGEELVVECAREPFLDPFTRGELSAAFAEACCALGLDAAASEDLQVLDWGRPQQYAKILPISERERRRFLLHATDVYNIYSLGRFATWRPGLLLDDVLTDVHRIREMIAAGNTYTHR